LEPFYFYHSYEIASTFHSKQGGNTLKIIFLITRTTLFFCFVATTAIAQQAPTVPFAQREVKFENGIIGKPLTFESATPRNFEEIIGKATLRSVKLDGQLFVPAGAEAQAVVILAPGSGGVMADHLKHAQALTSAGLAVYVLDPFAGRGIKDTSSDQTQLTHAASAYDILACARMLATQTNIDGQRIGALGYSRGGAAILLAAHQQMTRAVLEEGKSLKAVLVGWPLCLFQFEHALTAPTVVRFLVGDSDNRTSPAMCQGQATAMRANNPQVSIRLFKEAHHGFGYSFPLREFPNVQRTRPYAPIFYINDQGAFLDLYTGQPIPGADQISLVQGSGWTEKVTVSTGTKPGQSEAFVDDMVGFFKVQLKP
jgi:dienelactone hydrolase